MMYIRVRVKGVLKGLLENTTVTKLPAPLIMFLNNICTAGSYVPDGFLTPFMLNRVDTDNYGAFISLDEVQIKMITSMYLYCKIMIMDIFVKYKAQNDANATAAQRAASSSSQIVDQNYRVIATILYFLIMKVLNERLRGYERQKDVAGGDVFG